MLTKIKENYFLFWFIFMTILVCSACIKSHTSLWLFPSFLSILLQTASIIGLSIYAGKIISFLSNSKLPFRKTFLIFSISLLAFPREILVKQIYGNFESLGIIFPLFLLFGYWLLLIKAYKTRYDRAYFAKVCVLALFASAISFHTSLLALLLTLSLLIFNILGNRRGKDKTDVRPLGIILLCSFIGFIVLHAVPAYQGFLRTIAVQSDSNLLASNSPSAYAILLPNGFPFVILLTIVATILFFATSKKREKLSWDMHYLLITSFVLFAVSTIQYILNHCENYQPSVTIACFLIFSTSILLNTLPKWKNQKMENLSILFYLALAVFATYHGIHSLFF